MTSAAWFALGFGAGIAAAVTALVFSRDTIDRGAAAERESLRKQLAEARRGATEWRELAERRERDVARPGDARAGADRCGVAGGEASGAMLNDLDTALRDIRAIVLDRNWSRIEITVRADGRVEIDGHDGAGYHVDGLCADLDSESALELPSVAVAEGWLAK